MKLKGFLVNFVVYVIYFCRVILSAFLLYSLLILTFLTLLFEDSNCQQIITHIGLNMFNVDESSIKIEKREVSLA